MNEKKQINECIEYFRNSSIWKRIFKGFKEKYSSYGRFSGKVIVRNPEDNDIEELEGFFGQNFHGKRSITISAEKFEKALKNSRFKEVSPEEILNAYFGAQLPFLYSEYSSAYKSNNPVSSYIKQQIYASIGNCFQLMQ